MYIMNMALILGFSLETRLDTSPHLKPGYNHKARPEFRPDCTETEITWFVSAWFHALKGLVT
jgi:hypothetical protein